MIKDYGYTVNGYGLTLSRLGRAICHTLDAIRCYDACSRIYAYMSGHAHNARLRARARTHDEVWYSLFFLLFLGKEICGL